MLHTPSLLAASTSKRYDPGGSREKYAVRRAPTSCHCGVESLEPVFEAHLRRRQQAEGGVGQLDRLGAGRHVDRPVLARRGRSVRQQGALDHAPWARPRWCGNDAGSITAMPSMVEIQIRPSRSRSPDGSSPPPDPSALSIPSARSRMIGSSDAARPSATASIFARSSREMPRAVHTQRLASRSSTTTAISRSPSPCATPNGS